MLRSGNKSEFLGQIPSLRRSCKQTAVDKGILPLTSKILREAGRLLARAFGLHTNFSTRTVPQLLFLIRFKASNLLLESLTVASFIAVKDRAAVLEKSEDGG